MTVQNGRCRDGGLADAAGRRHRTSVILDITKRKVQGTHGRGGTVERMVAGQRMGGGWADAAGRRHGVTT